METHMKSPTELKLELARQADLKELKERNELIEWLEMVIGRYISEGKKSFELYEADYKIGKHYTALVPIMKQAGYTLSKNASQSIVSGVFCKPKVVTETKIIISWT